MTNYEALIGSVSPFSPDRFQVEKAMADYTPPIDMLGVYSSVNKQAIAEIAVGILIDMLVISKESGGEFSMDYSREGVITKIKKIANENGITLDDDIVSTGGTIQDKSYLW